MFAGVPPVHPVLLALERTIVRRRIPAAPFLDLIEANVMDQRVTAYAGWEELERYCTLSAAPVGRMVLRVFDVIDGACERLSDDVCIGLQLANHAQDVSRDAALGRTYLLQSDLARGGMEAGVRGLVERARALLQIGTCARAAGRIDGTADATRALPNGRRGHLRRDRAHRLPHRSAPA